MAESLTRELILPATRVSVPDRPNERTLAAIAKNVPHLWTSTPRDIATQQVMRLVIAEILRFRLTATELPSSPDTLTIGEAAHLFSPHVRAAEQAFQLAFVEAVNAGIPAAVGPLRDALRKVGVTGREPLRAIALGLDRLAPRAAQQFWTLTKPSSTLTALVGALTDGSPDVSGLDRRLLAHADAVVLGGGKATAITIGRRSDGTHGWLPVPLSVSRRARDPRLEPPFRREATPDLGLRSEGWSEVFEPALEALSAAMQQLDTGERPKGRLSPLAETLAARLVAAKARTAIDVVASLRTVEPVVLDLFDEAVKAESVRIAVQVPEDEQFAQLWVSTSALSGPLLVGSADMFFGGGVDLRVPGESSRPARGGAPGSGRPGGQGQGGGQGRRTPKAGRVGESPAAGPGEGSAPKKRKPRRRRPAAAPEGGAPAAEGATPAAEGATPAAEGATPSTPAPDPATPTSSE